MFAKEYAVNLNDRLTIPHGGRPGRGACAAPEFLPAYAYAAALRAATT